MSASEERLFELLASKATEGLSRQDSENLDNLLIGFPEIDPQDFEKAAAAVHLALLGPEQPMPERVKLRLVESGERHAASLSKDETQTAAQTSRSDFQRSLGWWAAAAALAIAVVGWWPRPRPVTETTAAIAPSVEATSEQLLNDPRTLRLAWTATEDATAGSATGEVIWNNDFQTGYMRFAGLQENDPTIFQYQLWIFDRARDERYPVDGGVFDISSDGTEILVPIEAKIRISEPYLFAVTVEAPGGVVVSTRERIALLAQA